MNLHMEASITAAITTPKIKISNVMFPLKIIHANKNNIYICTSPNTFFFLRRYNSPILFHSTILGFICNSNFIQFFYLLDYPPPPLLWYNATHDKDSPSFLPLHSIAAHTPYAYKSAVWEPKGLAPAPQHFPRHL